MEPDSVDVSRASGGEITPELCRTSTAAGSQTTRRDSRPSALAAGKIGLGDDVVPVEHGARLVPGHAHRHALGNAGACSFCPGCAERQAVRRSRPLAPHVDLGGIPSLSALIRRLAWAFSSSRRWAYTVSGSSPNRSQRGPAPPAHLVDERVRRTRPAAPSFVSPRFHRPPPRAGLASQSAAAPARVASMPGSGVGPCSGWPSAGRKVDLGTAEIVVGLDEPPAYLGELVRRHRGASPRAGRSPGASTPRSICAGTHPA